MNIVCLNKIYIIKMGIIDTHSHIYLEQFDEDRDEILNRCKDKGVDKILMPNIDKDTIESMMSLHQSYPQYCLPMMGLHPTSVDSNYKNQLDVMYRMLSEEKFYAIGEIGVDLYWDKTYINEQLEAFKIQLKWAKEFNLPVVIHARDAFDEIFVAMDGMNLDGVTGVFHSFGGSLEQAKKALNYKGFLLGINGVVTFKNSGLDKVIQQLELRNIVLETDAPYLTPVPYRGKRNEPSYLNYIVDKLSVLFNVSNKEVEKITTNNAQRLFAI